ncbi:hypothetical protein Q7P37_003678 [Cladosporium fusiforme]
MASRALLGLSLASVAAFANGAITSNGTNFRLDGDGVSYLFHVDTESGEIISDHFGGPVEDFVEPAWISGQGWVDGLGTKRREFPDFGRSDLRLPAIHIGHADGNTITEFNYQSHEVLDGKPALPGLPATYGDDADVSTIIVKLYDNYSDVSAALSYSIFPKYNAVARSFQITNNGTEDISIERAASFSTDLPNLDNLEMIELQGDWSHEMNKVKRPIQYGETSFRSGAGYSSHIHNPFFALASQTTTESQGEAWGFNLVYSGSFEATTERFSNGLVRVLLGLNSLHASIPVKPGDTFTSPEAVAIYSSEGLGGMSRSYHDLYRHHLSRSNYTLETRPVLLNSWEGLYFEINDTALEDLAQQTADLGISLFVNDDGWFGQDPYARLNDTAGLGDWTPNENHFPGADGFKNYVANVNNISVANSTEKMKFGLWFEPEMVNPNSTLYHEHPDWVMHAGEHTRTLTRSELVLNLGLPEVQDFVINSVSNILDNADVSYIKWDNNRGIHEMSKPSDNYDYMLGIYHVIDTLTTKYPDVLWEGCASGGGRFDAGLLHYWPQHWTSDNTDAADRLNIQLGTSLAYPPSAMGCHVSVVPNHLTHRNVSIEYRAHVALMCGSFGFELKPSDLTPEESAAIPNILQEWKETSPIVITGSFYRLRLPDESNWPAVQFISKEEDKSFVLAFQQSASIKPAPPPLRLQGLDADAKYSSNVYNGTYSGKTLMNSGLNLKYEVGDYQSQLVWFYKE